GTGRDTPPDAPVAAPNGGNRHDRRFPTHDRPLRAGPAARRRRPRAPPIPASPRHLRLRWQLLASPRALPAPGPTVGRPRCKLLSNRQRCVAPATTAHRPDRHGPPPAAL